MALSSRNFAKMIALCGLSGVSCLCLAALITSFQFIGRTQEGYSLFNHFISELGHPSFSPLSQLFNSSLMITGLLLFLFFLGLFFFLKHPLRYMYLPVACVASICCFLVGVYPANQIQMHVRVAAGFFNLALLGVLLFSISVFLEKGKHHFHRLLSYSGLLPLFFLAAFTIMRLSNPVNFSRAHILEIFKHRPAFWLFPFLEWGVFFSMMCWVLMISYALYQKVGIKSLDK
jgi:hypothetical membrane protein